MDMIPFQPRELAEADDVVFEKSERRLTVVQPRKLIESSRKLVTVGGVERSVTREEIARAVKYLTQSIGEYKQQDLLVADVIVNSLRKARQDLVMILEEKFHVTWQLIDNQSRFYEI